MGALFLFNACVCNKWLLCPHVTACIAMTYRGSFLVHGMRCGLQCISHRKYVEDEAFSYLHSCYNHVATYICRASSHASWLEASQGGWIQTSMYIAGLIVRTCRDMKFTLTRSRASSSWVSAWEIGACRRVQSSHMSRNLKDINTSCIRASRTVRAAGLHRQLARATLVQKTLDCSRARFQLAQLCEDAPQGFTDSSRVCNTSA